MIADLLAFLRDCLSSGALLTSLCAMLVVPPAVWLGIRALAPVVAGMDDDREWQAALAATAAILPGGIFLVTAAVGIAGALTSGCLQYAAGRVLFAVVLILTFGALIRASWLATRRLREVRLLLRVSGAPSARLARNAADLPLRIQELADDAPFCAVGGGRAPTLLVSRGTVACLNDAELRAALWHEYGHVVRHDTLSGSFVAFFADLLPLCSDDLAHVYRQAREFAADAFARRATSPSDVAGAIVALARAARPCEAFAALAADGNLRARVTALFHEHSPSLPARRLLAIAGLAVVVGIGSLPLVAAALHFGSCTMRMIV